MYDEEKAEPARPTVRFDADANGEKPRWRVEVVAAVLYTVTNMSGMLSVALLLQGSWDGDSFPLLLRHVVLGYVASQIVTTELTGLPVVVSPSGWEALPIILTVRSVVNNRLANAEDDDKAVTFVACSATCTLMSAIMMLAAASRRELTELLHIFPAQVRSGVFAAIGISIFSLGFAVFELQPFRSETWEPSNLIKFGPAYVLGIGLLVVEDRCDKWWLTAAYVAVVVGGAWAFFVWTGLSLSTAADRGLVLGSVPVDASLAEHFTQIVVENKIRWDVVIQSLPDLALAAFVGPVLNVGINVVVLEVMFDRHVSYRGEFFCQGAAALATTCVAGYQSYTAVSETSILVKMSGLKFAMRISCVLLIGIVAWPRLLSGICALTPTYLPASLFCFVGANFTKTCLFDDLPTMTPVEYAQILTTCLICLLVSVPVGVAVGFALAAMSLVRIQSQVTVTSVSSLADERSHEPRTPAEDAYLDAHDHRVLIVDVLVPVLTTFNNPRKVWDDVFIRASLDVVVFDLTAVGRLDTTSLEALASTCKRNAPSHAFLYFVNVPDGTGEKAILERYLSHHGLALRTEFYDDTDADVTGERPSNLWQQTSVASSTGYDDLPFSGALMRGVIEKAHLSKQRSLDVFRDDAERSVVKRHVVESSSLDSSTVSIAPENARDRAVADAETRVLAVSRLSRGGWSVSCLLSLVLPRSRWPLRLRLCLPASAVYRAVQLYAPHADLTACRALTAFVFHTCSVRLHKLKPGNALVGPGRPTNKIYVVVAGRLTVYQEGVILEKLAILGQLASTNCWAGERSALGVYSADHAAGLSVVATTNAVVLSINLGNTATNHSMPTLLVRMLLTKSLITMRRLQLARSERRRQSKPSSGDNNHNPSATSTLSLNSVAARSSSVPARPSSIRGVSWATLLDTVSTTARRPMSIDVVSEDSP